jgi:16S rRNA (cytidine1402-2'-O)-methyltransferase
MRAVETLSSVSRIYAEDTRHSQHLLRHHGIETRLHALHEHNEAARAQAVVRYLQTDGSAALITDAGTPLISDPGYRLVRACHEAGITVSPIPGASALTAALSVSGLPTDRFLFVGFPPAKSTARRRWFESLAAAGHTLVMFESPHRIVDSLSDLREVFGADREMTLARELTKRFETLIHGKADDVLLRVKEDPDQQRGEFVLVVAGNSSAIQSASEAETDHLLLTLLKHMPVKTVARCAAEMTGMSRKQAYDRAIALQGKR